MFRMENYIPFFTFNKLLKISLKNRMLTLVVVKKHQINFSYCMKQYIKYYFGNEY